MIMTEIWKDIEGYEGLYQVSNQGRVKSLPRQVWNGRGMANKKGKLLSIHQKFCGDNRKTKLPYEIVNLSKKGKGKTKLVSRLVAAAFIPNLENKPQVNHKDRNTLNNTVDNLEWSTNGENQKHRYKTGDKAAPLLGKDNSRSRKVICFDLKGNKLKEYASVGDAARDLQIQRSGIIQCANNYKYCKTYKGMKWEYV